MPPWSPKACAPVGRTVPSCSSQLGGSAGGVGTRVASGVVGREDGLAAAPRDGCAGGRGAGAGPRWSRRARRHGSRRRSRTRRRASSTRRVRRRRRCRPGRGHRRRRGTGRSGRRRGRRPAAARGRRGSVVAALAPSPFVASCRRRSLSLSSALPFSAGLSPSSAASGVGMRASLRRSPGAVRANRPRGAACGHQHEKHDADSRSAPRGRCSPVPGRRSQRLPPVVGRTGRAAVGVLRRPTTAAIRAPGSRSTSPVSTSQACGWPTTTGSSGLIGLVLGGAGGAVDPVVVDRPPSR